MKNKILIIGIIVFILLLIGSFFISLRNFNITGNIIKENDVNNIGLEKYRSQDIPEDCRLPGYENDIDWWKQHLSHHKETLYCLDYFE